MIPIRILGVLCIVATTSMNLVADQRSDQIDQLFAEWNKPDSPGAAVGVIHNGKLVYSKGYGLANLEHNIPIDDQSLFYMASVSKQFTAACIALLAVDGQLSLDDDIRKYLPELPEYPEVVTIRHLVHHTSGLKDYLTLMTISGRSFRNVFTAKQALALIASQSKLNYDPGDEYQYSNSGYFLMAQIVERVSGKSFREFARERIFEPLGMENTFFHDDHLEVIKNRVSGYERKGDSFRLNAMQNFDNVGSGGLRSCIDDLVKWDRNFYEPRIGGKNFLQAMLTRGKLNDGTELTYAFGLVIDRYKGLPAIRHGGAMMGFRTHLIRFPEQQFSVICLGNVAQLQPGTMVQQIADIYLCHEIERSIQAYVGRYTNESLDATYTVTADSVSLWIDSGDLNRSEMTPSSEEKFTVDGMTFQFRRNDGGDVSSLSIGTSRAGDTLFSRAAN
jgi:CubicO group peptidase (beta-lactamase class C family)